MQLQILICPPPPPKKKKKKNKKKNKLISPFYCVKVLWHSLKVLKLERNSNRMRWEQICQAVCAARLVPFSKFDPSARALLPKPF